MVVMDMVVMDMVAMDTTVMATDTAMAADTVMVIMVMVITATDSRMDTVVIGITVIGTLAMAATGMIAGTPTALAHAGDGPPLAIFGFAVTENASKGLAMPAPS
jgi:hypothetical protein